MLVAFEGLKKNFKLKPADVTTDNLVFRLHYRITTLILLVWCIMVSSQQYIGEHIHCINDKGVPTHVMNTFCFFTTTFTIVCYTHLPICTRCTFKTAIFALKIIFIYSLDLIMRRLCTQEHYLIQEWVLSLKGKMMLYTTRIINGFHLFFLDKLLCFTFRIIFGKEKKVFEYILIY